MSLLLRTDVTAVKLYGELILAGIGSHIHIFNKTTHSLLQRYQALKGQKIYGFMSNDKTNKILVFGGKQFTILIKETEDLIIFKLFDTIECDDWVHDIIWIKQDEVAILTAHNVLQFWNIESKSITSKEHSCNNSILYSGVLLPLSEDLLVLAGTVYSEVIIHNSKGQQPLHSLKGHRGVIFSISCDLEKETIVTTSDDRSVRIWGPERKVDIPSSTLRYWENITIDCKYEVYGHLARVMRSVITSDHIVSVGEDSAICYWDFNGKLVKKCILHQNGCIWSLDADATHLVTGGGDGSVQLHPLTVTTEYGNHVTISVDGTPKRLVYTAKGNIVVLTEDDYIVYYEVATNISQIVCQLKQESTYKMMSTSTCKQIIAVADMVGNLDIFIENCKENILQCLISTTLNIRNIMSMHWAGNRYVVLCCSNGAIYMLTANRYKTVVFDKFLLPKCKERWLTAAAVDPASDTFVVGDRSGNLHFYVPTHKDPMKTIRKVHGSYGPTSITFTFNKVITTGRDGTVKYFSFGKVIKHMHSVDLYFQWVEHFLDKSKNFICGFQERAFVVYDLKSCTTLLEVPCGGGHRSWAANRFIDKILNKYEEFISLVYLKNSTIHKSTFQLNKIVSRNILNGSHGKEINCLEIYHSTLNRSITFIISGGEDTTLRVSSVNMSQNDNFRDVYSFKQLSNVRCIKTVRLKKHKLLLISAGGRAQICIKILQFVKDRYHNVMVEYENIVDYLIKGRDKERKGGQNWRNSSVDFDPETRVMCVDIVKLQKNIFYIFAGCSDTLLRIFKLTSNDFTFTPMQNIKHHHTCILKTHAFKFQNKYLLVTATTRGEIAIWDLFLDKELKNLNDFQPIFTTRTNQSGINSLCVTILNEGQFLLVTGGDDNAIYFVVITADLTTGKFYISNKLFTASQHSGLVSGVYIFDNKYLLSASIDQRVTLSEWLVTDTGIDCKFLSQNYSDVSDIQGLDVVNISRDSVTVCVYGKGLEMIKIAVPSSCEN